MSPMLVNPFGFGGGAPASYGWAPTDVSGLKWWFRSDVGVSVTVSGGNTNVDAIADQSGNGLNITRVSDGGGPRVVRQSNATAGIDEILHQPGGTAWAAYTFDTSNPHSGLTACHLFWGVKFKADPQASTAETGMWYLSDDTIAANGPGGTFFTDGKFYDNLGGTDRGATTPVGANPTPAMTSYRTIDVQNGASGYVFSVEGTSIMTKAGQGNNWVTAPTLARVGNFPTIVRSFNGTWLDWFMYDHVLTGTDLTNARAFVQARFDGSWLAAGGDG